MRVTHIDKKDNGRLTAMQKVLIYTFVMLCIATLTGCGSTSRSSSRLISFPGAYKIDVQQGNVITQKMVNQLRPGMTRNKVRFVMGSPLLEDSFNKNRWDYVYSLQPGGKERSQRVLTIFFKDDGISSISGDFKPGG